MAKKQDAQAADEAAPEVMAETHAETPAPPAGAPWAAIIGTLAATPAKLEAALHGAGILTLDDLRRRPAAALGVLQSVYGLDLAALIERAEAHYNKE